MKSPSCPLSPRLAAFGAALLELPAPRQRRSMRRTRSFLLAARGSIPLLSGGQPPPPRSAMV